MPSVVSKGIVSSAANIDSAWLGVDADELFTAAVGQPVAVLNDADAAGVAEMTWGSGRGRTGVVICLTFGTGIGSWHVSARVQDGQPPRFVCPQPQRP